MDNNKDMKDMNNKNGRIEGDNKELSHIANYEAGLEAGEDEIVSDRMAFVAGLEAGTDVYSSFDAESGVTENAPYKNLAKYKMVTDMSEDEDIQNTQGS